VNFQKALRQVLSQLHAGEQELTAISATLKEPGCNINPGALVLTSERLVFVGSLLLERSNISIPVNSITSVGNHGVVTGFTVISVGGAQHRFLRLPVPFLTYLDEIRAWARGGAPSAQPVAAGGDMASQIQQLATMHQSGVLTDAEFVAAKTRLLG
jgi:hypothetical protein